MDFGIGPDHQAPARCRPSRRSRAGAALAIAVLLFLGLDVFGLFSSGVDAMMLGRDMNIAHSAHLGGALAGLVVALPVWWRQRQKRSSARSA